MFRRLLLNPAPVEGGGAQTPTATPTATPSSTPTPAPTISISLEAFQRYQGLETQVLEIQRAKDAEIAQKEADRVQALAQKGEIEKALELQKTGYETKLHESTNRYVDLEKQVFGERKSAVLAQSFAGRSFVGESPEAQAQAASQLQTLLESKFETVRDSAGQLVVRDKLTGRPASEVLKETLDSGAYNHFFAPRGKGGSGGNGNSQQPLSTQEGPQPGSAEAVGAWWRDLQQKYASFGLNGISRGPDRSRPIS